MLIADAEFGGDHKALEKFLVEAANKAAIDARRKGRKAPTVGIGREQAERMAADQQAYDSKIVAGRLTE